MPTREVLCAATIEGARALGLGDEVGLLEPGKQVHPDRVGCIAYCQKLIEHGVSVFIARKES